MNDIQIAIAPAALGLITPSDVIKSTGTMMLVRQFPQEATDVHGDGCIFDVFTGGYRLQVGFKERSFYIHRNNDVLMKEYLQRGMVRFSAIWTPNRLYLEVIDEHRRQEKERTTLPVFPPNSLVSHLRIQRVLPVVQYPNGASVFEAAVSAVQSVQDKVDTIGLIEPFWNKSYDGRKISFRKPKLEPDIHPTIHGLIYDMAIARTLDVIPEYEIAGGNLDFLVQGHLASGGSESVCVEFKPAHSDDLEHGLATQLPQYMRAKGATYGVYGVLYFRGPYFEFPRQTSTRELWIDLNALMIKSGLQNVRIVILDLSYKKTPSKL